MELRTQSRDMFRDDLPDEFQIDSEVLVDNHIPETDYLLPGDFRVRGAQLRGHAPAGLAKQRQTVQHGALDDQVVEEGVPPRAEKLAISSICSMASRRRRRSVLIIRRRHASLQMPGAV